MVWGVLVLSGAYVWCEGSVVNAAGSSSSVGIRTSVAGMVIRVIGTRDGIVTAMSCFRIGGIRAGLRVGKSGGSSNFRVVDGMSLVVVMVAGGGVNICRRIRVLCTMRSSIPPGAIVSSRWTRRGRNRRGRLGAGSVGTELGGWVADVFSVEVLVGQDGGTAPLLTQV